jgi:hypothetical protein
VRADIHFEWRFVKQIGLGNPCFQSLRKASFDSPKSFETQRESILKGVFGDLGRLNKPIGSRYTSRLLLCMKEQLEYVRGRAAEHTYIGIVEKVLQCALEYFPDLQDGSLKWFRDPCNFVSKDPLAPKIATAKTWFRGNIVGLSHYLVAYLEEAVTDEDDEFITVIARVAREELMRHNRTSWQFYVQELVPAYFSVKGYGGVRWPFLRMLLKTAVNVIDTEADVGLSSVAVYRSLLHSGLKFIVQHWTTIDFDIWEIVCYLFSLLNVLMRDLTTINDKVLELVISVLKRFYGATGEPCMVTPDGGVRGDVVKLVDESLLNFKWHLRTVWNIRREVSKPFASVSYAAQAELQMHRFTRTLFHKASGGGAMDELKVYIHSNFDRQELAGWLAGGTSTTVDDIAI